MENFTRSHALRGNARREALPRVYDSSEQGTIGVVLQLEIKEIHHRDTEEHREENGKFTRSHALRGNENQKAKALTTNSEKRLKPLLLTRRKG